jgi:hypothetical protein
VNGTAAGECQLADQVTDHLSTDPPTTFDVFDGHHGGTMAYPARCAFTAGGDIQLTTAGRHQHQRQSPGPRCDKFTIEPQRQRRLRQPQRAAAGGLQTRSTMTLAGGTASYQSAYAQIVSASATRRARWRQVTATAQESMACKQAKDARQSLSGVNLDEEAANLLRYQQAYQASGKMIEIAGKLFDEIARPGPAMETEAYHAHIQYWNDLRCRRILASIQQQTAALLHTQQQVGERPAHPDAERTTRSPRRGRWRWTQAKQRGRAVFADQTYEDRGREPRARRGAAGQAVGDVLQTRPRPWPCRAATPTLSDARPAQASPQSCGQRFDELIGTGQRGRTAAVSSSSRASWATRRAVRWLGSRTFCSAARSAMPG